MSLKHVLSRNGAGLPWHREPADDPAAGAPGRRRAGRSLALLAVSGLLSLSGVIAGAAVPASAGVITLSLSASQTTQAPFAPPFGIGSTLTATTNLPVPAGLVIEIFDVTANQSVCPFPTSTHCITEVSQNVPTTHAYVAYVAKPSATNPPAGIQATSATSYVTWTNGAFRISLSGNDTIDQMPTPVTATVTGDSIAPSPFFIEIFDETTGKLLNPETGCGNAQTCTVTFTPRLPGDYLVAFVTTHTSAYPPPLSPIAASSNVLFLQQLLS